jgi:hypothetical protein
MKKSNRGGEIFPVLLLKKKERERGKVKIL